MYLSAPFRLKKTEKNSSGGSIAPPLFLDQTEARRAEKISLGACLPPAPLSKGLDDPLPSSYLKVWIRVFVWTDQGWFIYHSDPRLHDLQPSCT